MMINLTWYGHATLGLETGDKLLLIDPYFSDNPAASTTADKVEADFILITHGHHDHVGDAVEIAKRTGATTISNVEISRWLAKQGVKAQGLQFWQNTTFPFGEVELTPAVHGTGLPDGADGGQPGGFILKLDGKKLYIAGDTALFDDMKRIGAAGLDLAVLPIGGFYTMDPDQSLQAIKILAPKHAIPYHYNTWDKIVQYPNAWAARVEKETTTRVHVLKPGGNFNL
jgi:L-ascorbate metabolism protein UlaG (beta-lactamase superfamily)